MAQKTAFLNSLDPSFNKDYHHTMVNDFLFAVKGVMFKDLSQKDDFSLSAGRISGGKAMVPCVRTTGPQAGVTILALFESTADEPIDTTGNKKVYIEIPQSFVNDSMTIDISLTQGNNLNVGKIVSASSYPTNTNYIPLWEITGGDVTTAVDKRPVTAIRGMKNSLVWYDATGSANYIPMRNEDIDKVLTCKGQNTPPIWGEGGGGGGGASLKNTYVVGNVEGIVSGGIAVSVERLTDPITNITTLIGKNLGDVNTNSKISTNRVSNGDTLSTIQFVVENKNGRADNLQIRLETIGGDGKPSGALVATGAEATIAGGSLGAKAIVTANFNNLAIAEGTPYAIVLQTSGGVTMTNYYIIYGIDSPTNIAGYRLNDGGIWWNENKDWILYAYSTAFQNVLAFPSGNTHDTVGCLKGISENGGGIGQEISVVEGGIAYAKTTANEGSLLFAGANGIVSTTAGSFKFKIGEVSSPTGEEPSADYRPVFLKLDDSFSAGVVVVDETGNGDYTSLQKAMDDGAWNIIVKTGTYDLSQIATQLPNLMLEGDGDVTINIDSSTVPGTGIIPIALGTYKQKTGYLRNVNINFLENTRTAGNDYLIRFVSGTKDPSVATAIMTFNIENCTFGLIKTAIAGTSLPTIISEGVFGSVKFNISFDNCMFNQYTRVGCTRNTAISLTTVSVNRDSVFVNNSSFLAECESPTTNTTLRASIFAGQAACVNCWFTATTGKSSTGSLINAESMENCKIISAGARISVSSTISNSTISLDAIGTPGGVVDASTIIAKIPEWASGTAYTVGKLVFYQTTLVKCNTAHTSTTSFDFTKFDDCFPAINAKGVYGNTIDITNVGYLLIGDDIKNNKIGGLFFVNPLIVLGNYENVESPASTFSMTGNNLGGDSSTGDKSYLIYSRPNFSIISDNNIFRRLGAGDRISFGGRSNIAIGNRMKAGGTINKWATGTPDNTVNANNLIEN